MIARASADISFKLGPDCLFGRIRVALDQVNRTHDHARRAEAALQAMMFPEGGLHRVKLTIFCQTFYGCDIRAISLNGQHGAGLNAIAIHMHRTGATLAGVTADMGAG
tara:strand:- start:1918 stop:2241 length:324 start_codon:yes stop_codon:yes gene_type:complete